MIGALAALVSVAGCSPEVRYRVLALVFEEVPPGGDAPVMPVVRSPRHPAPATPTPTPGEAAEAGVDARRPATFSSWDDVVRLLPKDQVGNPDWVTALEEKTIAPRAAIASQANEQDILALDVELTPRSAPAFRVTFSHQKHGGWLACPNCHSGTFEMKAGATPMTAEDVHGERYCGACHGKVAFDTVTGCLLCHLRSLPRDTSGRVDWSRALAQKLIAPRAGRGANSVDQPTFDLDIELTPKACTD